MCVSAACNAGKICAAATTARPEATVNDTIDRFISFPPWLTSQFTEYKLGGGHPLLRALNWPPSFDDAEIGVVTILLCLLGTVTRDVQHRGDVAALALAHSLLHCRRELVKVFDFGQPTRASWDQSPSRE